MAFGPIMKLTAGELNIELAPLTRESMSEFIAHEGGLQRYSITRYLGMRIVPTLEDEHEWYEKTRTANDVLVWGIWVVQNGERTLIGNTSLNGIGKEGHTGFIRSTTSGSMIFRSEYWGRGIASAAHKARTWYAFQHLGLHRIDSEVVQGNDASRKALLRSGYILTHTKRNDCFVDGKLRHLDCFECINPLNLFWDQWWHEDTPSAEVQTARQLTQEVLDWAEKNVTLA